MKLNSDAFWASGARTKLHDKKITKYEFSCAKRGNCRSQKTKYCCTCNVCLLCGQMRFIETKEIKKKPHIFNLHLLKV